MNPSPNRAAVQGLVVSDLHLFARRSDGARLFESLRTQLSRTDVLVLNGDTFDFRWSTLRNQAATRRAALHWLTQLIESLPRCRVHLLQGNHDCLKVFEDDLRDVTQAQPRFEWHEHTLLIGRALFLHGDCAQYTMDQEGLIRYRNRWKQDGQRGELAAAVYTWADRLGITRFVHEWHFPRKTVITRLTHYLDGACSDWRDQIRSCYFGHTHLPLSNYVQEGVTFHNTGSGIRKMGFNPVPFQCDEDPNTRGGWALTDRRQP